MAKRVLLHVGTPKTGTTYLQDVCFLNRSLLEEHGILYPADRFDAHFLAALDLMRLPWGGLEEQAVGAWDRLAAEVRAFDGTAIISHEILARATPAQAQRALTSLGHGAGTEVHLVLSVRDLVRQIPAEWQENVKHRTTTSYADFLAELQEPARDGTIASWFWAVQELPDILARWRHDLPASQVHLVTVPLPDSPRDLLWSRFVEAFGLGGLPLALDTDRANVSLGVPETYLLRQVNLRANLEIEPEDYRELVRELLAHRTLSARVTSPRLALPPSAYGWVSSLTANWIEELADQGYDVVGSLAELQGEKPSAAVLASYVDPDAPDLSAVVDAAATSIVALVGDVRRWRANEARLHEEIADLHRELAKARMSPLYRLKEALYRLLTGGRLGRRLLDAYYRARGSSSRLA